MYMISEGSQHNKLDDVTTITCNIRFLMVLFDNIPRSM